MLLWQYMFAKVCKRPLGAKRHQSREMIIELTGEFVIVHNIETPKTCTCSRVSLVAPGPSLHLTSFTRFHRLVKKAGHKPKRQVYASKYSDRAKTMSRPAARKAAPKGEYIETVSDSRLF